MSVKYERIPYLVVFDETAAFKDTYAGQMGKVTLEAHLLKPEAPSDTVVVMMHPIGGGAYLPMPGLLWVVKEVDVLPSIAYTLDEFAEAVEAVASGAIDTNIVVSDVRPLDAAEASFNDLVQPGGPVKVLLSPSR